MPYETDDDVPAYVPEDKRAQWREVWNSVYKRCINDGGDVDTCEEKAFKQANGVVKDTRMSVFRDSEYVLSDFYIPRSIKLFDKTANILRIPTVIESVLYHWLWGELRFDAKWMNQIIANFEDNVLGQDVPVDAGHNPDAGALGWVKELKKEKVTIGGEKKLALVTYAEPTQLGLDAVMNDLYRYASISYNPDFVHARDLAAHMRDPDNVELKRYGPVMYGVALTNVPFITNQEKVKILTEPVASNRFSEELSRVELDSVARERVIILSSDWRGDMNNVPAIDGESEKEKDSNTVITFSTAEFERIQNELRELQELKGVSERLKRLAETHKKEVIEHTSEKALGRGVAKPVVEFITWIMEACDPDDPAQFSSPVGQDMNLFNMCRAFLETSAPVSIQMTSQTITPSEGMVAGPKGIPGYSTKEDALRVVRSSLLSPKK